MQLDSGQLEEEDFCIYFMTYVLNLLVAPSCRNGTIDTSFLKDIENPENRNKLDLCAFAAEFLVDAIEGMSNEFPHVPGCVHICEVSVQKLWFYLLRSSNLFVVILEHIYVCMQLMFADVILTGNEQQLPPGRPRTCYITKKHIECAKQVCFPNLCKVKASSIQIRMCPASSLQARIVHISNHLLLFFS
jgi:hypothetical protein